MGASYRISARPRAGCRRAGRRWSRDPVTVPAAALTDAQIAALKGDPQIIVVTIEGPAAAPNCGGPVPARRTRKPRTRRS